MPHHEPKKPRRERPLQTALTKRAAILDMEAEALSNEYMALMAPHWDRENNRYREEDLLDIHKRNKLENLKERGVALAERQEALRREHRASQKKP